ncbi:hypothetical protein H257_14125 [Aphanomyces astaci]|uniref:DUF7769 domain-containing protein n=1 Tax=Aphanomyces astaci TaxID=112090 RepID=W4FSH4_APHAT|nr:hypothetical protein H257_14125 [Aphanomyces astaci]ETV70465.1 hypothetical protein H257_14125 [Aphanomyces astaci]|eukprot:XP_009840177.1 hypothetical protein H257_14125 [Aphanomyces astaci]
MSNQTLGASPAASVDVAQPPNGHKHLSPTERQAVYEMLLGAAIGEVLPRGVIVKAAKQFGCHERTVSRLWVRAQLSLRHGCISADVRTKLRVYDDEEVAARSVKSKHYITKVMFLAAVARPRYDHHSKMFWDGKVGVWPFVQVSPALRGSKNRPKGTLVTVPQAVDSTVYFDAVLNKDVHAIMAKFPGSVRHGNVFLQQDNASPHHCVTTELLQAKGVRGIVVANQPPNSRDFNVLDLGFLILFKVFSTKRQLVQSRNLLVL